MAAQVKVASRKSTIVRSVFQQGVKVFSALAPRSAEKWAVDQFGRPRGNREPAPPSVRGELSQPFKIDSAPYQLQAWLWGSSGPTVLLVHGWNGHAGQLSAFIPPLLAAGYSVAAIDLPAHGRSSGDRTNLLKMSDAVTRAVSELRPVKAVIAHSLGATATALAMGRGLGAERAVLLAPPAEMPYYVETFARAVGLPRERVPGFLDVVRAEIGRDVHELDLRNVLGSVLTPTLVVHDPDDSEVPYLHGQIAAEAAPNGTLLTKKGAGHRRILKDAEVISAAVRFIENPAAVPEVGAA